MVERNWGRDTGRRKEAGEERGERLLRHTKRSEGHYIIMDHELANEWKEGR